MSSEFREDQCRLLSYFITRINYMQLNFLKNNLTSLSAITNDLCLFSYSLKDEDKHHTFTFISPLPIFPRLLGSLNLLGPSPMLSPLASLAVTFFRDIAKFGVFRTRSSDGTKRPRNASLTLLSISEAFFTNWKERERL